MRNRIFIQEIKEMRTGRFLVQAMGLALMVFGFVAAIHPLI